MRTLIDYSKADLTRLCPKSKRTRVNAKGRGFSLVELMVALTIGLIIMLVVTVLFTQLSRGFQSTDDASRSMENGNFAMRILGDDLRLAGFVGLGNSTLSVEPAVTGRIASADADNCGTGDVTWPYVNANHPALEMPATLPCIPAGAMAVNSPIVVTRHATGRIIPVNNFMAGGELANSNRFFIQTGPKGGGTIFMGRDYLTEVKGALKHVTVCVNLAGTRPTAPQNCLPLADQPDAPIFEYAVNVYYVRPCSRPGGAVCTATDDGGDPVPTLVRRELNGTNPAAFVEVPVAEGVESLVLAFLDSNGAILPADQVARAVSVRISMVMRSRKIDQSGFDDSQFSYPQADGSAFSCGASGTQPCRYRRQLISETIALENLPLR